MATAQAPEPSWQCDKSLVECLDHLFPSAIACDVTFLVGEAKHRISAHRTILISRSPVFYAMFEGHLAEKGEILITDIEQEAFKMFLRILQRPVENGGAQFDGLYAKAYLYTDTIDLTVNTVTSVLSAARKYLVDRLVKRCETFLKTALTTGNVCLLLEEAHIYTVKNLKEDCIDMINRSPEEVLKSTSFVDLCCVCVKSITKSDDLAVEESMVYEAVIRWSEAECIRQGLEVTDTNRREVLGDIIYTVRFPIMKRSYLLQEVSKRDFLTAEQLVSVQRFQQDNTSNPFIEFSVNERNLRKPVPGVFECITRFTNTMNSSWNSLISNDNDSISFVSTVNMFLHGLQLYGSNYKYKNVLIGIYTQGGNALYTEKHMLTHETLCNIEFKHIIKLTPEQTYTVVLHGGVCTIAYGNQGISTVNCGNGQIRFMPSTSFPCQSTTVDRGQIPGLLVSF